MLPVAILTDECMDRLDTIDIQPFRTQHIGLKQNEYARLLHLVIIDRVREIGNP
jgi:hypothetical protein